MDSSNSYYGHMLILDGGNSIFQGARTVFSMEEGTNKRQPFFTSPEELLEEEYYDEQLPESKKRRLAPEQVHMLEKSFESENKLEPDRKSELAKKLGLQPRQVAVWFQNRRARWKTKQLERDFDCLKSAYDSLLADHENLLEGNDRLRSQVVTLTEKLRTKEFAASVPTVKSAHLTSLQVKPKVEDHLSTGSKGSAVVDGEGPQQIVDSYGFPENFQEMVGPYYGGRVTLESESEEDGSEDRCNYDMFSESQNADNWWVWST